MPKNSSSVGHLKGYTERANGRYMKTRSINTDCRTMYLVWGEDYEFALELWDEADIDKHGDLHFMEVEVPHISLPRT